MEGWRLGGSLPFPALGRLLGGGGDLPLLFSWGGFNVLSIGFSGCA